MNHNEEDWESEPSMANCDWCGSYSEIEFMVDCPKYAEDMGKGIIPSWVHEDCCEKSFRSEPDQYN